MPSLSPAKSVPTYIEDGARIAAILLVWGIIAAFFIYGVGEIGRPSSFLGGIGLHFGAILALAGVLNAVLYICYRAIDYWNQF